MKSSQKLNGYTIGSEITNVSANVCAIRCNQNQNCKAFDYSKPTRKCFLKSQTGTTIDGRQNWDHYVRKLPVTIDMWVNDVGGNSWTTPDLNLNMARQQGMYFVSLFNTCTHFTVNGVKYTRAKLIEANMALDRTASSDLNRFTTKEKITFLNYRTTKFIFYNATNENDSKWVEAKKKPV